MSFSDIDILLKTATSQSEVEDGLKEWNIIAGDEIYYTAIKQYEFYKQQKDEEAEV